MVKHGTWKKLFSYEKKLHHLGKIKQGSDSERMKGTTILVWSGELHFLYCRIERDPAVYVCVPFVYGYMYMYVYMYIHDMYIVTYMWSMSMQNDLDHMPPKSRL